MTKKILIGHISMMSLVDKSIANAPMKYANTIAKNPMLIFVRYPKAIDSTLAVRMRTVMSVFLELLSELVAYQRVQIGGAGPTPGEATRIDCTVSVFATRSRLTFDLVQCSQ